MTVLDPHGFVFAQYVPGIDRYTFWVMPGYLLLQAAWYKVAALSIFSMRLISEFWSVVALLSWFAVVRWLSRDNRVALLATFLLGTEQHFARSASTGRMDMMCAALGLLSMAAYVLLRPKLTRALFVVGCISAVNLFTHPNAIIGMVGVSVLVIYFDRRRLRWQALLAAFAPFLVLGLLWGLYVSKAPALLVGQLQAQANIPHRLEVPWKPWRAIGAELLLRYDAAYGPIEHFPRSLVGVILTSYALSFFLVLFVRDLRSRYSGRILVVFTVASFSILMCIQKNWYYLIFIIPFYTGLLAVASVWLWQKYSKIRIPVLLLLGLVTALQITVTGIRIAHDTYRERFLKATAYLQHNAGPRDLIMGSGELAFELGFDGHVVDDSRLGFLSDRRPEFIVIEAQYAIFWFPWYSWNEPATYAHIIDILDKKYEVVYDQTPDQYRTLGFSDQPYKIYKRRADPLQ